MNEAFLNRGGYAGMHQNARDYRMLAAFLPLVLMSLFLRGLSVSVVWLFSLFVSVLFDFLVHVFNRQRYSFSPYPLLVAMTIASYLPSSVSIYHIVVVIAFTHFMVLWPFGGRGGVWINPVPAAVVFLFLSIPAMAASFSDTLYSNISEPLFLLAKQASPGPVLSSVSVVASSFDSHVSSYLNDVLFAPLSSYLSPGYVDLFIGNFPGPVAAFSAAPVVLAGAFLLWDYVVDAASTLIFILIYAFTVWLLGGLVSGAGWAQGDVLFYLFSTDVFFAAFFVLSEPVSTPFSMTLSRFWSAFAGLLAAIFAIFGFFPFPALLAIGVGCVFVPLVDYVRMRFVLLQGADNEES